jgi:hypothetical protein
MSFFLCLLVNVSHCPLFGSEHLVILKRSFPKFKKNEKWLREKQNKTFAKWIQEKVRAMTFVKLIKYNVYYPYYSYCASHCRLQLN